MLFEPELTLILASIATPLELEIFVRRLIARTVELADFHRDGASPERSALYARVTSDLRNIMILCVVHQNDFPN